jgi:hypothetical protein
MKNIARRVMLEQRAAQVRADDRADRHDAADQADRLGAVLAVLIGDQADDRRQQSAAARPGRRNTIRKNTFGASPHSSDETVKMTTQNRKTRLAEHVAELPSEQVHHDLDELVADQRPPTRAGEVCSESVSR